MGWRKGKKRKKQGKTGIKGIKEEEKRKGKKEKIDEQRGTQKSDNVKNHILTGYLTIS